MTLQQVNYDLEPIIELTGRRIALLPDEYWWGGAVNDGTQMPFRHRFHRRNLQWDFHGNQATPLLLSSCGRYIWSEQPFTFAFEDGKPAGGVVRRANALQDRASRISKPRLLACPGTAGFEKRLQYDKCDRHPLDRHVCKNWLW